MTLTNTAITALRPGQRLKDDRVPGLEVRANATGKSFLLYYRTKGGTPRRPKIGDAATLSISDAREIAKGWLAKVSAGGDPSLETKVERQEPTLDELWDQRVATEHYTDATTWGKEAQRLYREGVKDHKYQGRQKVGSMRVGEIDIEHIDSIHKSLQATPFQANRTIAVLSKAFKLLIKWKFRPKGSNPCKYVERFPEPRRRRFASPDELAKIGPALDSKIDKNLTGVAFLYLLLFSGARPSEIENGTPEQIQRVARTQAGHDAPVVCGVLRLPEGKNGEPRDVFLPPQAMAVIDRLPAGRDSLAGRRSLPKRLWDEIRTEVGCPDLWARDMRRTFATVGYSNGVDKGMMGNLLGHASPATTDIYAKLMEDPAHRAAAATADAVEKLLKSGTSA